MPRLLPVSVPAKYGVPKRNSVSLRHRAAGRRPVVSPRVEYALTPLGESLLQAATTLLLWADAHQADLMTARDRYDEANRDRAQA